MRQESNRVLIEHVALAIVRRGDAIILVQQQNTDGSPPYWVIPGGLVEVGELISEALVREVAEETGAHVTALGDLAFITQIDRPSIPIQSVFFAFEVAQWHGTLGSNDPDDEIRQVALVPLAEAIELLAANDGWHGVQEPLLAYLRGEVAVGSMWFYREGDNGQQRAF